MKRYWSEVGFIGVGYRFHAEPVTGTCKWHYNLKLTSFLELIRGAYFVITFFQLAPCTAPQSEISDGDISEW